MPAKYILFDEAMTSGFLQGVTQVADAVRLTLGPSGGNVILENNQGRPTVTKRGAAVAATLELPDPLENIGGELLRALMKTVKDQVGDGSTASALLAESILTQGIKALAAGASCTRLSRAIEAAVDIVTDEILSMSEPASRDLAIQIGTTVAHDEEIGRFVADVLLQAGPDGIVHVEKGRFPPLAASVIDGIQLDEGFISQRFLNNPDDTEIVLDEPSILLSAENIAALHSLLPLLEQAAEAQRTLLLIAPVIGGEALSTLIINKQRGTLRAAGVKAPGFGQSQRMLLDDLATLTGGTVFSRETGRDLSTAKLNELGRAHRVVINASKTLILHGHGNASDIAAAAGQLERAAREAAAAEYDAIRARLARYRGRATCITVGGKTDDEVEQRTASVHHALQCVRLALRDGVVVGGGVALLRAADALRFVPARDDELFGFRIVMQASESVVRQLAVNSGFDGGITVNRVRESRNLSFGFNASTARFEDLFDAGVVDPTKVITTALQAAASVAVLMLLSRASVLESRGKIVKTVFERKYEGGSRYSVSRSLAVPPRYVQAGGLRAFGALDHDLGSPLNVGVPYMVEAGIERPLGSPPPAGGSLDFVIVVSASAAQIAPSRTQTVTLLAESLSSSARFEVTFSEPGNGTVEVEFYFQRVWVARIAIDVQVTEDAASPA